MVYAIDWHIRISSGTWTYHSNNKLLLRLFGESFDLPNCVNNLVLSSFVVTMSTRPYVC